MADENIKRTILCVDDEPDVVSSLFDTFMDDYTVKTANSGEEALNIFQEGEISLVITDQRMPEMEGTELLARIDEIDPICKKILLTGYADINAAVDAINKGAVDKYFNKPWEDEELQEAVKALLEEYSMDEFFQKAIDDAMEMKKAVSEAEKSAGPVEKFLNNYLNGICLVTEENKIVYLNKKGYDILKCTESSGIIGKEMKDVFFINEVNKQQFLDKYLKKDISSIPLDVKCCDGSTIKAQASITFASEESGVRVEGIVFGK